MKKIVLIAGQLCMEISSYIEDGENNGRYLLQRTQIRPGGRAYKQAIYAKDSGYHVLLLGHVGNDHFGRKIIQSLNEKGISTQYIETVNLKTTGLWIYLYGHENGKCYRFIDPGVSCKEGSYDKTIQNYISLCTVVMVNQWLHHDTCMRILQLANSNKIPSVFICSSLILNREKISVDFLFLDAVHEEVSEKTIENFHVRRGIFMLSGTVFRLVSPNKKEMFSIGVNRIIDTDWVLTELIDMFGEDSDTFETGKLIQTITRRIVERKIPVSD